MKVTSLRGKNKNGEGGGEAPSCLKVTSMIINVCMYSVSVVVISFALRMLLWQLCHGMKQFTATPAPVFCSSLQCTNRGGAPSACGHLTSSMTRKPVHVFIIRINSLSCELLIQHTVLHGSTKY